MGVCFLRTVGDVMPRHGGGGGDLMGWNCLDREDCRLDASIQPVDIGAFHLEVR